MSESPQSPSPLFSVVIATYNYGRFVGRAIDSVLAQTFTDFEIIVVDDGSTDDTPARLAPYGQRIRCLRKDNAGQASAYNDGIALARGRYICILDADDELLPDAFERFSAAIRAHADSEPCVFYAGYVSVAQNGSARSRTAVAAPADPEARLRQFLLRRLTGLQHCSSVISRELFEQYRYPEGLRNNTDIVLLGQIVANRPAIAVGSLACRVHDHGERGRDQTDKVLSTGLLPVGLLFDPERMPAGLMHLESLYRAERLRSIAGVLFKHRRYAESRQLYRQVLRCRPVSVLAMHTLKRWLISTLRS